MLKLPFIFCALIVLYPSVSSGLALFLGMAFALGLGNPFLTYTRKWTPWLLQASVVGLGGTMNLIVVGEVGLHGILYTLTGIVFTLAVGMGLGKLFKTDKNIAMLLSVGTAICGGSAIAAVAPTIRAKDHETSVALAAVFFLNATALFIFPWIGHWRGLDQTQFGLWSALAIHDTSSVVGAALTFGPRALEIATTVKLARALWIVPLTLVIGFLWSGRGEGTAQAKAKRPWFILGFLLFAALATWVPALHTFGYLAAQGAKRGLVLTLFFIGSGLTRATLKNVGTRPLFHATALWIMVASLSYAAITTGIIYTL